MFSNYSNEVYSDTHTTVLFWIHYSIVASQTVSCFKCSETVFNTLHYFSSLTPLRLNCRLLSLSGSCDAMSLKSRKMSWNVSSSPDNVRTQTHLKWSRSVFKKSIHHRRFGLKTFTDLQLRMLLLNLSSLRSSSPSAVWNNNVWWSRLWPVWKTIRSTYENHLRIKLGVCSSSHSQLAEELASSSR